MHAAPHIVILGAGFAALTAVRELRKREQAGLKAKASVAGMVLIAHWIWPATVSAAAGPRRAPTRMGWAPQSNGMPTTPTREAARSCGPGTRMNGSVRRNGKSARSMRGKAVLPGDREGGRRTAT